MRRLQLAYRPLVTCKKLSLGSKSLHARRREEGPSASARRRRRRQARSQKFFCHRVLMRYPPTPLLCFLTASVRHSAWLMHCSTNSSLLLRRRLRKKNEFAAEAFEFAQTRADFSLRCKVKFSPNPIFRSSDAPTHVTWQQKYL